MYVSDLPLQTTCSEDTHLSWLVVTTGFRIFKLPNLYKPAHMCIYVTHTHTDTYKREKRNTQIYDRNASRVGPN